MIKKSIHWRAWEKIWRNWAGKKFEITLEKNPKRAKNLFKQLINDGKSTFYATDKINKTLLNKARKSVYEKDWVLYKLFSDLEDENVLYENRRHNILFYTQFVE